MSQNNFILTGNIAVVTATTVVEAAQAPAAAHNVLAGQTLGTATTAFLPGRCSGLAVIEQPYCRYSGISYQPQIRYMGLAVNMTPSQIWQENGIEVHVKK
jgi:hypothetical protein